MQKMLNIQKCFLVGIIAWGLVHTSLVVAQNLDPFAWAEQQRPMQAPFSGEALETFAAPSPKVIASSVPHTSSSEKAKMEQAVKSQQEVTKSASSLLLAGTVLAANEDSSQQQRTGEEEQQLMEEREQWGTRQPTFPELDKNQDGLISEEEAEEWSELSDKFAQIDENDDNKIERSELRAFENKKIKESIQNLTQPRE